MKDDSSNSQARKQREPARAGLQEWLPALPSTSGDLFAKALVRLGWIPVGWSQGMCLLRRGTERIFVPREKVLEPPQVRELLQRAGVLPLEFIEVLERLCEREIDDISIYATGIRRRPQE